MSSDVGHASGMLSVVLKGDRTPYMSILISSFHAHKVSHEKSAHNVYSYYGLHGNMGIATKELCISKVHDTYLHFKYLETQFIRNCDKILGFRTQHCFKYHKSWCSDFRVAFSWYLKGGQRKYAKKSEK
jgi:hypothetical protein